MRWFSKWIAVLFPLFALVPNAAFAYRHEFHFYLTYVLAYECGLKDYAGEIAWATHAVDRFAETDPGTKPQEWLQEGKVDDRRVFHFPVLAQTNHTVRRDSPSARLILELALKNGSAEHPDPLLMGIGLHTYQDSWAHEGFGPKFGHAWTTAPDYPKHDVAKAIEMSHAAWVALDQWSSKVRGQPCDPNWDQLAPLLKFWFEVEVNGAKELAAHWEVYSTSITGSPSPMKAFDQSKVWQKRFLEVAFEVKKVFGRRPKKDKNDPNNPWNDLYQLDPEDRVDTDPNDGDG